jgi:hypothetical protein
MSEKKRLILLLISIVLLVEPAWSWSIMKFFGFGEPETVASEEQPEPLGEPFAIEVS